MLTIVFSTFARSERRMIRDFTKKVKMSFKTIESEKKKLTVAIVPLKSVNAGIRGDFGLFISEKMITIGQKSFDKITFVERNRFDAITKEMAITQSGLISEGEAQRIGKIHPIDFLLTGTYTKLESTIEISLRMINTVTGKIAYAENCSYPMTEEIKILFKKNEKVWNQAVQKEINKKRWNTYVTQWKNLQNKDDLDILAQKLIKEPYDSLGVEIHYSSIHRVAGRKLYSETFYQYLHNLVTEKINSSDENNVARAICSYFSQDNQITDTEWKITLELLKKAQRTYPYVNTLFAVSNYDEKNVNLLTNRAGEFIKLVEQGTVGKSGSIKKITLLASMFSAVIKYDFSTLYMGYHKTQYKKFTEEEHGRINKMVVQLLPFVTPMIDLTNNNRDDTSQNRKFYNLLQYSYGREIFTNGKNREFFLIHLIEYFNNLKIDKVAVERLSGFGMYLTEGAENSSLPIAQLKLLEKDRSVFVNKGAPLFEQVFTYCNDSKCYQAKTKAIKFCLRNNIQIENFTPTIPQLIKKIKFSDNLHAIGKGALYLNELKGKAKPAEKMVIKTFRKLYGNDKAIYIRNYFMKILVNIKSENQLGHREILRSLSSNNKKEQEIANEAIKSLGVSIMESSIKKYLFELSIEQQNVLIKSLSVFGREGRVFKKELNQLKEKTADNIQKELITDLLLDF